MNIKVLDVRGNWRQVADAARTTMKMDAGEGDPSDKWKRSITRAEHSPIRLIEFVVKTEGVKSWITVHNVRHKIGIEHFVSTQRNDRTGVDRDNSPQSTLVDYQFVVNLQELITICRKRFCRQAHEETRMFWYDVMDALLVDPKSLDILEPIRSLFVPECVYRGFCYEMKTCGYDKSVDFDKKINKYRS